MKGLLVSLSLLLTVVPAFAGQETRTGAGLGEQTFMRAWVALESVYRTCLAAGDVCLRAPAELEMLGRIAEGLRLETEPATPLKFESGSAKQDLFKTDCANRVAVTTLGVPNSPIWINLDLVNGTRGSIGFSEAVAVLTHEVGHHFGYEDHARLDLLGARLAAFLERKTETIRLDTFLDASWHKADHSLIALHLDGGHEWDVEATQLLISDGASIHDITAAIRAGVRAGFESVRGGFSPSSLVRLYRLRWDDEKIPDFPFVHRSFTARVLVALDGFATAEYSIRVRVKFANEELPPRERFIEIEKVDLMPNKDLKF